MVDRYDAFLNIPYKDGNAVKYTDYQSLEAELAEAKAESDNLRGECENWKDSFERINENNATLRARVAELEAEVERLNTHAVEVYKEQRKAYLIQQAEMERLRKSDNVCGGHLLSDCE